MKIITLASLILLSLALPARTATSSYRVEIRTELKRLDVKRSTSESTETAEEQWGYVVTVTNHSFKDIPDLRVDYVEFSRHEHFGSKSGAAKDERTSGSKALGNLQNNGKTSFETDPVTLKKARLKADWYYANGAKGKAKDEMSGVWVRVFSGSEMIDEYAQPSSLKTQEKWEG